MLLAAALGGSIALMLPGGAANTRALHAPSIETLLTSVALAARKVALSDCDRDTPIRLHPRFRVASNTSATPHAERFEVTIRLSDNLPPINGQWTVRKTAMGSDCVLRLGVYDRSDTPFANHWMPVCDFHPMSIAWPSARIERLLGTRIRSHLRSAVGQTQLAVGFELRAPNGRAATIGWVAHPSGCLPEIELAFAAARESA